MTSALKTFNIKYIHVVIMLLFLFGFQFLPPIGTITPVGMKTLGIFIGIIYGWNTMGMIWPSFLGLFALSTLPTLGGAIATFQTGFGDRITVALFLFLIFGELVSQCGLSQYIADWCVTRSFIQGKPYAILLMFCLAGCIIGALINVLAGIILVVGIFFSFCEKARIKPGDMYASASVIAIVYTTCMASDILPFMNVSLLINGLQESFLGVAMPYGLFTMAQSILVLVATMLYFVFLKFIVKPDTEKVKAYIPEKIELKMSGQQKLVLGLLFCMLVLLFLPGVLPSDMMLTVFLKKIDIAGILVLIFAIYYVANINNDNVIPFDKLAKNMNWSIVLMFTTITPLTVALQSEDAGIMENVTNLLNGLIGDLSPMAVTILILFIASIMTQFCNNMAIILIVLPVMYSFAVQLGINPVILSILVAFNLNIAFCTPAASAPAAILYANTKWIKSNTMYYHGLVIFVINMIVTVAGMFIADIFI